ncbi:MAG TPA: ATP-binding protein, partial [Gammaproteobacteria bacterium]|nr:ATP-binding protein [Gammaproteobacteria bacterium]
GEIVGLANHTSLIARDGREYQIADSAAPIRNKTGKVTGVVLVFHDVSRQYRQQALIAAREAELRKITSILPGPVSHIDHHGRYIFVSEVFASWFGKPAEEVIGQTQLEVLGEDLYAQIQPYIFRARNGEPVSFEITIPTPTAGPRHTLVNVIPDVDGDEAVRGLFIIGMDISQLKLAEQEAHELRDQLIQATKMEAVGHLTAGIAHDFNNMLGAILGYTELTQHVIASGKLQDTSTYLAAILKAGNRAKELIAQMLTFSRKSTVAANDVPVILLAPIIKEVVSLLRSSIPSTIDLNYQLGADDLQACIHPVHLHQIIINLGINARDAIGEYGKIEISLSARHDNEQVCDSCKHPFGGDYVQLTVRDNGSGIPKDILARIFDPFFTTKGVGKGTGMGLSVVHGLVHTVGGHILVESSGNGTAISILLPVVNASLSAPDTTAYSLPKSLELLKGIRILVVDDEPTMATMMQEVLNLHGANVTLFNDPLQALASLENNPQQVDLVITDETMPGLSGMHLATKMLAINPALPIILCTGYSENASAESAEANGLAGCFYKPVK